jgi:predicted AAA+ superfamily ATPase
MPWLTRRHRPKKFLQKLPRPLIIDEAQKCPKIFDAVKFMVDREKRPGSYILTGSTQFSAKIGIRESLTGRIGIHYLYPMTLAEASQKSFEPKRASPDHALADRFPVEAMISRFHSGGLPVPLFIRDESLVRAYFQSWTDTSVLRDAARSFKGRYDPDVAYSILSQIAIAHKNGEYAGIKHFKQTSRVARNYLGAFEDIFLIQKLSPHEATTGSDIWTFSDTGILSFFAGGVIGEGLQLSFARIAALNEILAVCEYSGNRLRPKYYKTARGAPIDLVWGSSLIKISNNKASQVEYDLRPLRAAMSKLQVKRAHRLWGLDSGDEEMDASIGKITIAPWTRYS